MSAPVVAAFLAWTVAAQSPPPSDATAVEMPNTADAPPTAATEPAAPPAPVAAPAPPPKRDPKIAVEDVLRRAKNEYAYGNYEKAIELLTSLLYPMRVYSDQQQITARRYLALTYYLLDKRPQAESEFKKMLFINPNYELDPFTVAPPIIELFEAVRKKYQVELDAIREQRSDTAHQDAARYTRTIKVSTVELSEFATFLPFGIGQFQNGDIAWGFVFAIAEVVLLSLNIGSYVAARNQRENGSGHYPPSRATLIQALTIIQYSSVALFGITWSVGVFHSRLNFVPKIERRTVTDEPISRPGGQATLRFSF